MTRAELTKALRRLDPDLADLIRELRDKADVLDYIAAQSTGNMSSLILHWYPTPPPRTLHPKVKPFTAPNPCTCIDVTGYLDPGEHFKGCPVLANGQGTEAYDPLDRRRS